MEPKRHYEGPKTEGFTGKHNLTLEREMELTAHFHQCEVPFLTCDLCAELYDSIGYQKYKQLCELYPEDLAGI